MTPLRTLNPPLRPGRRGRAQVAWLVGRRQAVPAVEDRAPPVGERAVLRQRVGDRARGRSRRGGGGRRDDPGREHHPEEQDGQATARSAGVHAQEATRSVERRHLPRTYQRPVASSRARARRSGRPARTSDRRRTVRGGRRRGLGVGFARRLRRRLLRRLRRRLLRGRRPAAAHAARRRPLGRALRRAVVLDGQRPVRREQLRRRARRSS